MLFSSSFKGGKEVLSLIQLQAGVLPSFAITYPDNFAWLLTALAELTLPELPLACFTEVSDPPPPPPRFALLLRTLGWPSSSSSVGPPHPRMAMLTAPLPAGQLLYDSPLGDTAAAHPDRRAALRPPVRRHLLCALPHLPRRLVDHLCHLRLRPGELTSLC